MYFIKSASFDVRLWVCIVIQAIVSHVALGNIIDFLFHILINTYEKSTCDALRIGPGTKGALY